MAASRLIRMRDTVTILITNNREVRALNARFKGENRATDVLSFPAAGFARGFAGDIVISAEIAGKNAKAIGNSLADEVKILVLHGVLHLAGFDHETDSGEMAAKELHLRQKLQLPGSLIERKSTSQDGMRKLARRGKPARPTT